jgi:hypothetical protein
MGLKNELAVEERSRLKSPLKSMRTIAAITGHALSAIMYNYSAFQEIQHLPKLTKKWTAKRYHPV